MILVGDGVLVICVGRLVSCFVIALPLASKATVPNKHLARDVLSLEGHWRYADAYCNADGNGVSAADARITDQWLREMGLVVGGVAAVRHIELVASRCKRWSASWG